MGGERASTTRQRETGKICCVCHTPLRPLAGHRYGERFCDRHQPTSHTLEMKFERLFDDWSVILSVKGGRLVRRLTFHGSDKVLMMAQRGRAIRSLADKHAIESALSGRGGLVELRLTQQEFDKLTNGKPDSRR